MAINSLSHIGEEQGKERCVFVCMKFELSYKHEIKLVLQLRSEPDIGDPDLRRKTRV